MTIVGDTGVDSPQIPLVLGTLEARSSLGPLVARIQVKAQGLRMRRREIRAGEMQGKVVQRFTVLPADHRETDTACCTASVWAQHVEGLLQKLHGGCIPEVPQSTHSQTIPRGKVSPQAAKFLGSVIQSLAVLRNQILHCTGWLLV